MMCVFVSFFMFFLGKTAGPDGRSPEIGSEFNDALRSDFSSASRIPTKGPEPEKSRSLGEGRGKITTTCPPRLFGTGRSIPPKEGARFFAPLCP